jgi:nucleoside-diphosphate-sugar epimerase
MIDLVTGATGFIGSHLAQRLIRNGRHVRVLCRARSEHKLPPDVADGAEIVRGDLRDEVSLRAATRGVARVFHCAGQVLDWGPMREFEELNVRGTHRVLEAARAARVSRVVHFSSIAVFGTPLPPRFDDASPYGTSRDAYTRTKIEAEKIARAFAREGLAVTILRPAVVYGPRGKWLEEPLAMLAKGRLFLVGGGTGTCHPCYVENLVDATVLAADHPRAVGRAFIVGDDDPITFRCYFDAIAGIAGRPPIGRSVPLVAARALAGLLELGARATRSSTRPMLTRTALDMITTKSVMSMEAIKTELGFAPHYDFAAAIAELGRDYARSNATFTAAESPFPRAETNASLNSTSGYRWVRTPAGSMPPDARRSR